MEEALIKRVMPHSIEAEQSVVGAMLMDKDAITTAGEIISGDDFYQASYGVIFDSMIELFNEGKPVDLITLQERLKEKDVPAEIASLEFVRDLVTAVPTSANVKYYAQIVADKSVMRKMIKLNEEIENMCYAGKEPLESIMEQTEKSMFQLLQRRTTGEYVPIKQVVLNALDRIEKASKSKGTVTGIPTGFIDLDYKLSGFQPSDFILIAARPSMGKTAFVLNIAQYFRRSGKQQFRLVGGITQEISFKNRHGSGQFFFPAVCIALPAPIRVRCGWSAALPKVFPVTPMTWPVPRAALPPYFNNELQNPISYRFLITV